jgi:opacity protein-like surface antigen
MKGRLATVVLLSAIATSVHAAETPGFFYGAKGGFMKPDGDRNDSAFNIGGVIGQPIQRYFSWEAELTVSVVDGEVGGNEDWDILTLAGYGVFRSEGKIGFKGKAGVAYWDADSDDDLSLSLGVGVGFRLDKTGMLDIEYTQIDDQVDFISVGYLFNFR